ncbi:ATP-binding protein [Desmospora profundinema]|uniref:DNA repair exonuclease SbcCD ATPase subunit n=1 Tax=Desmospora profundinema TaxID=1571184 RepID=A0ABU1IKE8_9BACL|nr:AAA family ATPase [Desmospora profundinema]MDR6225233.1 DNA repair exonuclease SbcCD ATPase subunit [Desmospora profundinema]
MKIQRLHFQGFGRWVDRSFTFDQGINLVEAPNEAGKSTLINGLLAMMYGGKKEGVTRRQRADWLDSYRPWKSNRYGGELDFSVQDQSYRLIRSLHWEEEREQLIELATGRDLTASFPMDRRKDRNLMEHLAGIPSSLFTQVSVVTGQSLAGDQQMVERIRQLVSRGEELNLKPALEQMERELSDMGKTSLARTKPYGAAFHLAETLEQEVIELRAQTRGLREEQALLSRLRAEAEQLRQNLKKAQEEAENWKQRLKREELRQNLTEKEKNLRYKMDRWRLLRDKQDRLEKERVQAMPPTLLTPEEADMLRGVLEERNFPESRVMEIEERLEQLQKELAAWESEKEEWLSLDEGEVQRHLHRLEEYMRLEQDLLPPDTKGTMDDRIKGIELQKDHQRLLELREQEERCRDQRRDLEDQLSRLHRRKDRLERERFLARVVDSQIPPAKSSSSWLWMGLGGTLLSLITLASPLPGAGLLLLLFSVVAFFRFARLRSVDRQVRREWEERQHRLHEDWESLKREREEAEAQGEPMLEPGALQGQIAERKAALQTLYDQLAALIQEQETILDRWHAETASELQRLADQQRQRIQEREAAWMQDRQNRARMKEIQREAESWASGWSDFLGPFEAEAWRERLEEMATTIRQTRDKRQRLKLELASLHKDWVRSRERLTRIQEQVSHWRERLGTEDPEIWSEIILMSDHVRRLDEQLMEVRNELDGQEQLKREERWEEELERVRSSLETMAEWPKESLDLYSLQQKLKEADLAYSKAEWACRQQETEILKLEERLETRSSGMPSLSEREALWYRAREKVKELEEEKRVIQSAREVLEEAAREVQADIVPRLRPHATHWVEEVTGGRYKDLLIDPTDGIRMSVFVPETGERQPVEQLSRGTIDQMYFALRLALVRFFSENGKTSLPILMDDSLVHFDGERLREALRILGKVSKDHQIILCTCHQRERRMLEEEGIPFENHVLDPVP